jgi:hypothetical protein
VLYDAGRFQKIDANSDGTVDWDELTNVCWSYEPLGRGHCLTTSLC